MIKPFKSKYLNQITQIVNQNWDYNHLFSSKTCRLQARHDIFSCLNRSSEIYIDLIDNKVNGFLMSKTLPKNLNFFKEKDLKVLKKLSNRADGNKLISYNKFYTNCVNELIGNTSIKNEIIFFAVDKKRLGSGKRLLSHLVKNLDSPLFVQTDSTCDIDFYFSQGFKTIRYLKRDWNWQKPKPIEFYLLTLNV